MQTFWQQNITSSAGKFETPKNTSILIVGAGLAGTSAGYFLLQQQYRDFSIVDCGTENASYFRNAGHILHGASETYKAMCSIHGREKTKAIFNLSLQFCQQIKETISSLNTECDYFQGNYLAIASDPTEIKEITESIELMQQDGFNNCSIEQNLHQWGFKTGIAKKCMISAQANPSKFRNQLTNFIISRQIDYFHCPIENIEESPTGVNIYYKNGDSSSHQAVILATNAYSPLVSKFFKSKDLITPFKGQIVVSKPLKQYVPRMLFSMDHGYIYGTITHDNRLLIGGWRNNIPGKEIGTYDLQINQLTESGLKNFAIENLLFENLEWDYSWAGIMGSSATGLPLIGPVNNSTIYSLAGCTGYGFGWFHGCSKLLVDIMLGNPFPQEAYLLGLPKL